MSRARVFHSLFTYSYSTVTSSPCLVHFLQISLLNVGYLIRYTPAYYVPVPHCRFLYKLFLKTNYSLHNYPIALYHHALVKPTSLDTYK